MKGGGAERVGGRRGPDRPTAGSAPAAEVPQEGEQPRHHGHEADDGGEKDGQRDWNGRLPTDSCLAGGGGVVAHDVLMKQEAEYESNLIERVRVRYAPLTDCSLPLQSSHGRCALEGEERELRTDVEPD